MFSRHFVWAGLVILTAATSAAAQTTGTVVGTITAEDGGAPVGGVAVRVVGGPQVAIARGDGSFRLLLPAGNHELQATLIGYAPASATVTVVPGQSHTQNFTLRES